MNSCARHSYSLLCRLQVLGGLLLLAGCAASWSPQPVDEAAFLERAQIQENEGVRVTAAVPSKDETKLIFGANLYKRGVQPVWVELVNDRDEAVTFLPLGIDNNYFTPLEASSMYGGKKKRQGEMQSFYLANGMSFTVDAGVSRSGFVFTHLDEGTKSFNIDIANDDTRWHFTFFIEVPGLNIDHRNVDFKSIHGAEEIRDLDGAALAAELEAMPCCTSDKGGTGTGDPLNIVVIGDPLEVYHAFIRAGWDETEVVSATSGFKTAVSFISGSEYRYSPVSSLYTFGRPQDIAFQKIRENIHERNHLRLWMSPVRHEGKAVWIGQISRDIGVRFTKKTITTHKIDAQVDDTREYLVENLAYHQALAKLAYVGGVGPAPADTPRGNLTGDPYFTDGQRVVLWLSSDPIALDQIEMVDWSTVEE